MTPDTHHKEQTNSAPAAASAEDLSKDRFFHEVAKISEAMIAAHGADFAMGVLVLGARFIAEKKPFYNAPQASACCGGGCHDHSHHHHKS